MKALNKSKLNFSNDVDYFKKEYNCELCGSNYRFDDMSTCDRCQRFICDSCSETVVNRDVNPFLGYDFLCIDCIKELENNL